MFPIRHYLSELLFGTSVVLALSSCSVFAPPSSTSLRLREASESGWKEILAAPYVYEISRDAAGRTYMTAIKDCENKKSRSALVSTRQLLVGMKDIKIVSQNEISLNDTHALRTHVRARLENHALDLLTYTVPDQSCLFDFVLWRSSVDEDSPANASLLASDQDLARFLAEHFQSVTEQP